MVPKKGFGEEGGGFSGLLFGLGISRGYHNRVGMAFLRETRVDTFLRYAELGYCPLKFAQISNLKSLL